LAVKLIAATARGWPPGDLHQNDPSSGRGQPGVLGTASRNGIQIITEARAAPSRTGLPRTSASLFQHHGE
jgi:hypothetical protein